MNRFKVAVRFRLLVGSVAMLVSGVVLAGQPLFLGEATPSRAALASSQQALSTIASRPETFSFRVMRADASVVAAQTHEIELDLGHERVNAVLAQAHTTASGSLVWTGQIRETARARVRTQREVRSDDLNSVILVRRGNGITGTVRVDGQLYRIRPLPDGSHAVIEVDESRMPPDHPADAYRLLPQVQMDNAGSNLTGPAAAAPTAIDTIRVQVVATSEAVSAYGGDMLALTELAVAETNQGYANSGVGIDLELSNYRTVNYNDVGFSTDLARFRSTNDGYFDDIHDTRDANAADLNMLIINDSSYCGLASGIGTNASTAFAAVYWDCATGYYSFGHELGHLQSARHDPANDPSTSPYAYGHGYQYPSGGWRTIMAYNCTSNCTRLNYWSNPNKTYSGVAMGTTSQSHNQRALDNTKAAIANFRSGGTTPPPTGNVLTKGVAKSGLGTSTGNSLNYTMVVPAGSSNLVFNLSGGSGDADMYVKFGSAPTDSSYDCRPYKNGNTESCSFASPQAGTYHVRLKAYSTFSGASLVGDYSTGGGGQPQTYSNTSDYTINDNATVDSPITVSGRSGNGPASASIAIDVRHTYKADLKIDLVAPDGTLYNLHNRSGGSADNVIGTYTRDLSSEALNGTWKLRVNDNYTQDTGTINSWSVTF